MEDLSTSQPLFKKVDRAVFEQVDKFRLSPNYTAIQDFYNGLEEEQQKVFKALLNLVLVLLPLLFLGFLFWQNSQLQADLAVRKQILEQAQNIIGQTGGLRNVSTRILSQNPIDSQSMMSSRLSNLLAAANVDTSKIRVSNFDSQSISSTVFRSEADVQFNGVSTEELTNMFTTLIQRERFRISAVNITKNQDTNLLSGQFHAVHFSAMAPGTEEE